MKFTFEYDPQKSARNNDKHGIDFARAQALWIGEVIIVPAKVVDGEMRYANIGKIGDNYWTAIVSYRGAVCRIVSVYPSNPLQINHYERSRKRTA